MDSKLFIILKNRKPFFYCCRENIKQCLKFHYIFLFIRAVVNRAIIVIRIEEEK